MCKPLSPRVPAVDVRSRWKPAAGRAGVEAARSPPAACLRALRSSPGRFCGPAIVTSCAICCQLEEQDEDGLLLPPSRLSTCVLSKTGLASRLGRLSCFWRVCAPLMHPQTLPCYNGSARLTHPLGCHAVLETCGENTSF